MLLFFRSILSASLASNLGGYLMPELSGCSFLSVPQGFFTTPQFASIFLVLGLFASVSMTLAFFLGLKGSFCLTSSVACFLDVLFEYPDSPKLAVNAASSISRSCATFSYCFLSRNFRTLSFVCSLIFFLLFCSSAQAFSLFFFRL